ncbi:hypothetical protein Tco_1288025 [Tanacetum coccineum]
MGHAVNTCTALHFAVVPAAVSLLMELLLSLQATSTAYQKYRCIMFQGRYWIYENGFGNKSEPSTDILEQEKEDTQQFTATDGYNYNGGIDGASGPLI